MSMTQKTIDVLGDIRTGVQRAVLGADAQATSTPAAASTALAKPASSSMTILEREDVQRGGLGVVGLAAGAYLWEDHRFLGGAAGLALGSAVPAILRGEYGEASRVLVPTAAALGVSLMWEDHPGLGFGVGLLIGGLVEPLVREAAGRLIK